MLVFWVLRAFLHISECRELSGNKLISLGLHNYLDYLLFIIHECIKCNQCNKYKSVIKYIPVSAPGTLGIYQTLIWSLVSKWFLGDIVLTFVLMINVSIYYHISIFTICVFIVYGYQIIQLNCNMGLSKYFYNQFTHMGLWFIGGLLM